MIEPDRPSAWPSAAWGPARPRPPRLWDFLDGRRPEPGPVLGAGPGVGPGPRDRVPLRTVTVLRWVAIAGQIAALLAATLVLGIDVAVGPASVAIGASVLVNLFATVLAPRARRLSADESAALLGFDVVQLACLLATTGGLDNPFAVLLLGPVAIAASVLGRRATLVLVALSGVAIAALGLFHLPLATPDGPLESHPLFRLGFGVALAIGVAFVALYARQVSTEVAAMNGALELARLELARAQRLADLDGVVAAAAHELGTPLATVKLAASEMIAELEERMGAPLGSPGEEGEEGDPGLARLLDDARLLRAQADRCRDILREMGRAGRRDGYLDRGPLEAVLREAAGPHLGRGKAVEVVVGPGGAPAGPPAEDAAPGGPARAQGRPRGRPRQPEIPRSPEIVHGLRNLVQNAVDFAASRVTLRAEWTADALRVVIADDGPGFAPAALDRVGEPFMGRRQDGKAHPAGPSARPPSPRSPGARPPSARPGYEGMGLGLFIAKTLLERTGARLTFANAAGGGALVTVAWPRAALEAGGPEGAGGAAGRAGSPDSPLIRPPDSTSGSPLTLSPG